MNKQSRSPIHNVPGVPASDPDPDPGQIPLYIPTSHLVLSRPAIPNKGTSERTSERANEPTR